MGPTSRIDDRYVGMSADDGYTDWAACYVAVRGRDFSAVT